MIKGLENAVSYYTKLGYKVEDLKVTLELTTDEDGNIVENGMSVQLKDSVKEIEI